jgi:GTP-dependent phosphoenolpyruvate carboxykinase
MVAREPGQDRKVAALSGYYHVPQGCPVSRLCREFFIALTLQKGQCFFVSCLLKEHSDVWHNGLKILYVEKLRDL